MYYPALLILNNYVPLQLEEGMYFKSVLYPNTEKEYTELWELRKLGGFVKADDQFFAQNGYPVEIMILDESGETLANHEQIGWWDEGEHTDDLRDITLSDINRILKNNDAIEIDISEDAYQINQVIPNTAEGKVILRFPVQEYANEFDDLPDNEIEEEY